MQTELAFPKPGKKMRRKLREAIMTDAQLQEYVVARDGQCMSRLCLMMNPSLAGHHIIFKSQGGTNDPAFTITFCQVCHKCADEGGRYDVRKPRLPARQFVMAVIEGQQELGNRTWDDAYEELKRKEK